MLHPSHELLASRSGELLGKRIGLCVTGSVAAMHAPELARELMRRGARVYCAMSESAQGLVRPELLHWATGEKVVTRLTAELEHVRWGEGRDRMDLILIAPCTSNTIGKIAHGIDDTVVTTIALNALGKKIPLILVPAMHEGMSENPIAKENVAKLRLLGIEVLEPRVEEGKAKLVPIEEIAENATRMLTSQTLRGKTVLVTAGATREFLDEVRFVSNPSSGKMGMAIAREAWLRGARVRVIAGHIDAAPSPVLEIIPAESTDQMYAEVERAARASDFVVLAAGTGDFSPKLARGKLSSAKTHTLELRSAPKISEKAKDWNPDAQVVLFKAEVRPGRAEMLGIAKRKLRETRADLILANDVGKSGIGFGSEMNEVLAVDATGKVESWSGTKNEIARKLWERLVPEARVRAAEQRLISPGGTSGGRPAASSAARGLRVRASRPRAGPRSFLRQRPR